MRCGPEDRGGEGQSVSAGLQLLHHKQQLLRPAPQCCTVLLLPLNTGARRQPRGGGFWKQHLPRSGRDNGDDVDNIGQLDLSAWPLEPGGGGGI